MNELEQHDGLLMFTDGSVNTLSNIGFGACLILSGDETGVPHSELNKRIEVKQITGTSSTKLELQTLLWALEELLPKSAKRVTIYTDSQNLSLIHI